MIEAITQAVNGRHILTFRYDELNRYVEPLAVGLTS